MENEFTEKISNLELSLKQEKDKNRTLEENEAIKCEQCEFTTTLKKGLKTHIKRKHSENNKDKLPITCEVCDAEVRDKLDLKHLMISHTYTSADNEFKCEKCDFIGKNGWTMGSVMVDKLNVDFVTFKQKT